MMPFLAVLMLAAPVPKDEPLKPEAVTERHVALLRDNRVQRELGLGADHRVKLIDYFEAWDEENFRFVGALYPPSPGPGGTKEQADAKRQAHAEFSAKQWSAMRATVAGCLTAAQHARLKQLERRFLLVLAFELADTAAELKLSDGQLRTVKATVAQYREKFDDEYNSGRKPSGLPFAEHAKPFLKSVNETLSEAQRARWAELLGDEPKIATLATARACSLLRAAIQRDIDLTTPSSPDR